MIDPNPSFAAPAHAYITTEGIRTIWVDRAEKYVLFLGRHQYDMAATKLFLDAPLAQQIIASLQEAMAARGDIPEACAAAPDDAVALDNVVADLAELATAVEFLLPREDLGPRLRAILRQMGYVEEKVQSCLACGAVDDGDATCPACGTGRQPLADKAQDVAVDPERDRLVGL